MIQVIIKFKDQDIQSILIDNHALEGRDAVLAGDAYDMICNSVSVLGQSVIIGLDEVLKLNVNYEIGSGHLKVDLNGLNKDEKLKAQVILQTFNKSLESVILSLEQMFGKSKRQEYINLIKEEV